MIARFWICDWVVLVAVGDDRAESAELRPFTSRDAVEMAYFGNIQDSSLERPYHDGAVCPDGRYALKVTHRGVLPEGVTDGTSWLFDVMDVIESEVFVGASPIGDGLEVWLDKSPSLSTDSIAAAVLVSATDPIHRLSLWDFYAASRYRGKAVELQFIRSGKHNLVQPLHRMAHQELVVDWFDFRLNGHEDDAPLKADQYRRWRNMK